MKKILIIVLNIILAFLMLLGLAVAFTLLPIKNNLKIYTVMSGSMEPKISVGSLVVVRPESVYETDQIVTFYPLDAKNKKETKTHRIIEIISRNGFNYYRTKGDANQIADSQIVPQSNIIGRVLFSVSLLGYLVGYIKTLPGLIILIIIPATIIIYEEVRKIRVEAKSIIEKQRAKKSAKKFELNPPKKLPANSYKLSKRGGKRVAKSKKDN